MTLESAPSPQLPQLAALLEEHSASTGKPTTVLARIEASEIIEFSISDEVGQSITDENFVRPVVLELVRLIKTGEIPADGNLRMQSTPAPAEDPQSSFGDSGDLSAVSKVNNDGLKLRTALIKLGHNGNGYGTYDIDKAAKEHGATLPEIRFYRSFVREGKVAEGPKGDIFSSEITADFGYAAFDGAEAILPPAHPYDVVQPLLVNKLWVELAHDSENLYAADLAPGAQGEIGQIIGRRIGEVKPPFLVARSLTQFITGDWVSEADRAGSQAASASAETTEAEEKWTVVTTLLVPAAEEPVQEASPAGATVADVQDAPEETTEAIEVTEADEEQSSDETPWSKSDEVEEDDFDDEDLEDEDEEEEEKPSGGTFLDFAAIAAEDAARQAAEAKADEPKQESRYGEQINSILGRDGSEPEEEIKDLRGVLETHNADKLNETERGIANDFAAIAFGDGTQRSEKKTEEDEDGAAPVVKREEEPLLRREASENDGGFMKAMKKFFLG